MAYQPRTGGEDGMIDGLTLPLWSGWPPFRLLKSVKAFRHADAHMQQSVSSKSGIQTLVVAKPLVTLCIKRIRRWAMMLQTRPLTTPCCRIWRDSLWGV